MLIASPNSVAFYSRLTPDQPSVSKVTSLQGRGSGVQSAMSISATSNAFLSPLGIPCNAPPWGEIVAIDLVTSQVVWKRELGTTRDHAILGLAVPLGVPSIGGPMITAGGLAFIGAAVDDYLRAFDLFTGEELWRGRLSAGGHAGIGTTHGDAVVAFALPAL